MPQNTYYVIISYDGQRPEMTTISDAYKMYCELGGSLKERAFSEKAKSTHGVSLGWNGDVEITFTADLLSKKTNPAWDGISTLTDI